MAKDFKISTVPTFLALIMFMLISLTISFYEIVIFQQNDLDLLLCFIIFITLILIWGLIRTKDSQIVLNEMGISIVEKKNSKQVPWREISHLFLCSSPLKGLYIKLIFINKQAPIIIYFGKTSLWSINFYSFRRAVLDLSCRKDMLVIKSKQWYLKII